MTIKRQNKINGARSRTAAENLMVWVMDALFAVCAPLVTMWVMAEQRQAVKAYRKRNQLSEADFLEKTWEMGAKVGVDNGNN